MYQNTVGFILEIKIGLMFENNINHHIKGKKQLIVSVDAKNDMKKFNPIHDEIF